MVEQGHHRTGVLQDPVHRVDQHVQAACLAQHHPAPGQHRRLGAQELALAHAGHVGAMVGR